MLELHPMCQGSRSLRRPRGGDQHIMRQAAHAPPPRPPWTLQFPPLYPPATLTHTPPQTTSTIRTHRCLPLSNHPPHSMQHSTLHSTPHPPEQQLRHGHPPVTQTRGSQCRAPSRAPQPLTAGPTVTSHHSLPMGAPLQTLHAMKPFALIELLMLRRAQERRSMHRTRRLQTTWRPLCHANALHPCLLYTSPSPRDRTRSRMPSSA